jgi:hypothetical protein
VSSGTDRRRLPLMGADQKEAAFANKHELKV